MSWDDGKHAKVKRVQLTFDDVIRSIQVEYDGTTVQSQPRGPVGTKSEGFTLSSDEYITDLTGYYRTTFSGEVITALTFKTNKKTYGPYGNKTNHYFSATPPKDNQIAGFLGSSSNALNSIDIHYAPIPLSNSGSASAGGATSDLSSGGGAAGGPGSGGDAAGGPGSGGGAGDGGSAGSGSNTDSNPQKVEAQGGKVGNEWDDGDEHDGVTKIYVAPGGLGIEQIQFDYIKKGQPKAGLVHGVKGRGPISTFEIDHPNEYLLSVEGWYDSSDTIQGIQFKTNTKTSEYFGYGYEIGGDGKQFSLQVKDKKIVGFHGTAESSLNSIGAYFAPISTLTPLKPAKKLNAIGGNGGASWDDGDFDGVKKIFVGQGNDGVAFLKFEYNKGSQVITGDGRGKKTILGTETFELDYPSEYITSVEGYYDKVYGVDAELVTSLTFKTNKKTSQPFGMTGGKHFELKHEGHKIVGFHGKAGDYVHQIGVYVTPITD